ncbi:MAG: hypothetical protein KGR98_09240 [Verrucomicrobia bacterium]|nr:hypothetical protein [Verrucomicrobiota bacterium]MDE3098204.1 hypothetical protein [Verrucomicrobiota bacterium]
MKKILCLPGALALLSAFSLPLPALADATNQTAQPDFISTAGQWLSTIDYAKSWPSNETDVAVGGLWQNNVNWANYIGAQKNFGRLALNARMDNAGVAGTILRAQAGAGYRLLQRGDLVADALLDAGYDRPSRAAYVEPEVLMRKQLAHGAFAELGLTYDFMLRGGQPSYPGLMLGTGFAF